MPRPAPPPAPLAGLWLAGVATVAAVAFVLRLWMKLG